MRSDRFIKQFLPFCGILALGLLFQAGSVARAADSPAVAVKHAHSDQAVDVSPQYRIGPGDVLKIFVWQNPDLSVTVPVLPDGRISTPLDGDMQAVGKTTSELSKDIQERLAKYLKDPVVNVMVTSPHAALSQVSVIGEINHPESLPFSTGMTVMNAVLDAGGPTEWADLSGAKIVRQVDGKTKTIHVNLYALLDHGDLSQNLRLKVGDVIVIPTSHF